MTVASTQQLAGMFVFSSMGEVEVGANILFAPCQAVIDGLDVVGSVLSEEGREDVALRLRNLQMGLAGVKDDPRAEEKIRRQLLRAFCGIQGWPAVARRISAQAIIANGFQSSRRPSLTVVPPPPSAPTDRVAEIFSKLPPKLVEIWRDHPLHRSLFETPPDGWDQKLQLYFVERLGRFLAVFFDEWGRSFSSNNPIRYGNQIIVPSLIDLLRIPPLPLGLERTFEFTFMSQPNFSFLWWLLPALYREPLADRLFRIFELLKPLEDAACASSLFRDFLAGYLRSSIRLGREWNMDEFVLELADHFLEQYRKLMSPNRFRNISNSVWVDIQKEAQAISDLLKKFGERHYRGFEAALRGRMCRSPLDALSLMASGLI